MFQPEVNLNQAGSRPNFTQRIDWLGEIKMIRSQNFSADLIMSRTIQRKSPEFNASNDQNVILSKTVLKVKPVLPPSLETLEILEIFKNIVYFQIPRETRSNFDALSVWFLLTQYNVTLSKLYFTCQKMILFFWTVWHFPIWWHMICNMNV